MPNKAPLARGEAVPKGFLELFQRAVQNEQVTPRAMLELYYGAALEQELQKAEAYNLRGVTMKDQYGFRKTRKPLVNAPHAKLQPNIDKPVKVEYDKAFGSYHQPSQSKIHIAHGNADVGGFNLPKTQTELSSFVHELGHAAQPSHQQTNIIGLYNPNAKNEEYIGSDPYEFRNGLARLTREHFARTGQRVNTSNIMTILNEPVNDIGENPNYSPDANRTIKFLRKHQQQQKQNERSYYFFQGALREFPGLVQLAQKLNPASA